MRTGIISLYCRFSFVPLTIIVSILVVHTFLRKIYISPPPPNSTLNSSVNKADPRPQLAEQLFSLFEKFDPVPTNNDIATTTEYCFQISSVEISEMKEMQTSLLDNLSRLPIPLLSGAGIVMMGSKKTLRIALHSLRMLRRRGTDSLPVEFWVRDKSESHDYFWQEVWELGVRCHVLTDYIGDRQINGSQLISFVILFSSFEQVLFLDASTFPVRSIDDIFEKSNLTSSGVVVWRDPDRPDHYTAPVSLCLSQITGLSQRSLQTCDTAQILWNKRTHLTSLALACYYNYYGPTYFYPVMSQSSKQYEKIKQIFNLACKVTNQAYTVVDTKTFRHGYDDDEGSHGYVIQGDYRDDPHGLFIHASPPDMETWSSPNDNFVYDQLKNERSFRGDEAEGIVGCDLEKLEVDDLIYVECGSCVAPTQSEDSICGAVLKAGKNSLGMPDSHHGK